MGEAAAAAPPTFDLSHFHCLLDEQPTHLVPRYWESSKSELACALLWNPSACLCWDGELPPQLRGREDEVTKFDLQGGVLWVQDPANESWQPFWLGHAFSGVIAEIEPGRPAPDDLSHHLRSLLFAANILVRPTYVARRRKRWSEVVQTARTCFSRGFAPLAGLIHPYHIAALRRYVRHLIRNRHLPLGDGQSPLRYVEHNDPVLRFFHHQLTSALSDVSGEMLKPSYAYMGSYLKGAELPIHTDRRQCEFTISLCLDFAPEPTAETPWPLHLDTPDARVTVHQRIGDALFFRGRDIPHYRKRLERGTTSTSVFFHYVGRGFQGRLD